MRSVTRNTTKEKSPEAIKKELLGSIIEWFRAERGGEKYEELLKGENSKIIKIVGK